MKRIIRILIAATIFLIPAYLVRFTVSGVPTNVLEILILITFSISLLPTEKFEWKNFYKENKIYTFCVALIFAGLLISTLVNENYRTGFGIIKSWFIVPLVFAWVLHKEVKSKEDLANVLKWLYIGVFLVALVSLGYYFSGNLTYDGRLKAFYLSPNHLAMYLAPAIIIGFYFMKTQSSKLKTQNHNSKLKIYPILLLLSYPVLIASFYLTYSYAAWVSVIISLLSAYFIIKRKINKKIFLIGLIILVLLIISQWNTGKFGNLKNFSRSSLESRVIIWKSAGNILKDNPIWGIGPGNFQTKYLEYQKYFPPYLEWAVPQPHNLYLAFWLESGILGIAGFLVLIAKWIKDVIRIIKNHQNGNLQIASVLAGIMLYILIHGIADTTYWKNDLALIFWTIFSLGLIIRDINLSYESSHSESQ